MHFSRIKNSASSHSKSFGQRWDKVRSWHTPTVPKRTERWTQNLSPSCGSPNASRVGGLGVPRIVGRTFGRGEKSTGKSKPATFGAGRDLIPTVIRKII